MHPGTTKIVFGPEHKIEGFKDHSLVFEGSPDSSFVCSTHGRVKIFVKEAKVYSSSHDCYVEDIAYNTILSEVIHAWVDNKSTSHFLLNIKANLNSLNSLYILRFIPEEIYELCFCWPSEIYNVSSAEEKLSHDPITWHKLKDRIKKDGINLGKLTSFYIDGEETSKSVAGIYFSDEGYGEASIEDSVSSMLGSFEGFYNRTFECPEDGCAVKYILTKTPGTEETLFETPSHRNIMHMIIHFNDDHGWSREAIADWLDLESERQGFSIEFPDPEV